MGTADDDLLTERYWNSIATDIRVNPAIGLDLTGLDAFLREQAVVDRVLFATSGSSGEPKLVSLGRFALSHSATTVNQHLGATSQDRWLCALPTFHVGGYGVWARARHSGSEVIAFKGKWDALRFRELCQEKEVTLSSLVPTQVFDLVTKHLTGPLSLRAVIVGGGRLPDELGQRARALGWPVLASYGMTETGSQVATQALSALEEPFASEPLPFLQGWQARTDGKGRLELSGFGLCAGYVCREAGTWRIDTGRIRQEPSQTHEHGFDSWFATDDLATLLEGSPQQVILHGRQDRTVKVLGELVSLDRLERILATLAEPNIVDQVTIHAASEARCGHHILLVAEDGLSASSVEALAQQFNLQVAPFERIDRIARVPRIPRGALGKIQRARLEGLLR